MNSSDLERKVGEFQILHPESIPPPKPVHTSRQQAYIPSSAPQYSSPASPKSNGLENLGLGCALTVVIVMGGMFYVDSCARRAFRPAARIEAEGLLKLAEEDYRIGYYHRAESRIQKINELDMDSFESSWLGVKISIGKSLGW